MQSRLLVAALTGASLGASSVFAEPAALEGVREGPPTAAPDGAGPTKGGKGETKSPERPAITQVGEHRYRLGEIELDAREEELAFPVTVNMREGGPIEYLLVHETGKVHEAIFTTEVSPFHLRIAFELLGFRAGKGDVFNRLLPPEALAEEGGTAEGRGAAVTVHFRPAEGDEERDAAPLVLDGLRGASMTPEPWIYTGSEVEDGTFKAEVEGSIIAIYLDPLALFNMTREGADVDERWGANSEVIPAIGTRGTLLVRRAADGADPERSRDGD